MSDSPMWTSFLMEEISRSNEELPHKKWQFEMPELFDWKQSFSRAVIGDNPYHKWHRLRECTASTGSFFAFVEYCVVTEFCQIEHVCVQSEQCKYAMINSDNCQTMTCKRCGGIMKIINTLVCPCRAKLSYEDLSSDDENLTIER